LLVIFGRKKKEQQKTSQKLTIEKQIAESNPNDEKRRSKKKGIEKIKHFLELLFSFLVLLTSL